MEQFYDGPAVEDVRHNQTTAAFKSAIPKDRWVHSSDLHAALVHAQNQTGYIYVQDQDFFVNLAEVKARIPSTTDAPGKRAQPCFDYFKYNVFNSYERWGPWYPAGACLWTGNSPVGGMQNLQVSFSVAWAHTGDVGLADLVKAGVSYSFQYTQTLSKSETYACTVPGKSVGQMWYQTRIGYGQATRAICASCEYGGYCGKYDYLVQWGVPALNQYALGCSVGQSKVNCDGYQQSRSTGVKP